ncbi:MAG: phage distal tail protein, Rcc01695 family [Allorhizobium sp.]
MAQGFHEVRFPLRLSLVMSGGPVRRTDIVNLTNGRETRNTRWKNSRRAYDAGSGVRSIGDLHAVLEFFEARAGELYGFRFRDPVDFRSSAPDVTVSALDQAIGTGDGTTAVFQLVKTYGDAGGAWVRVISKPVDGTVTVAVDGVVLPQAGFTCDPATGLVTIAQDYIPLSGQIVQAGFEFDVPVRFDIDRIEINMEAFNAGRIPAIPLIEVAP